MPGMTDRDHFAAAALTGLLASREWPIDSDEAAHYCYRVADAMLRERERTNHDAAPAARASVESVAPQPTTRGDSDRTDKAAPRPSEGTGDTPKPISGCVSDRPTPITGPDPDSRVWETHTPATHATPGEGSEQRECTEPVAWGVASHFRVLATSISRMDAVDMQSDYACDTEIVPLYRHPPCQVLSRKNLTLTDAERKAVRTAADAYAVRGSADGRESVNAATLRGLLERLR